MNPKALIPLVVGLGIAGLAAKLGLDYIKKAEGKQAKMVQLWTPVADVPRGAAIVETMIKPLAFPSNAIPAGALADKEKIVGRVPHTGAPAGLPILDSMLLPPGVQAGVRVPPGLRAVAVKVDESSGVDYHLEPGSRVDVVGVFSVRKNNQRETIARTLLEDVEVAAVGARIAPSAPKSAEAPDGKSKSRESKPGAVTLLVKPEQVPTLHLAEQKGKIKLCLRGVLTNPDGSSHEASGLNVQVQEQDLLGISSEPQQAESPKTWADQLNEFVSSLWKGDQGASESEVDPKPLPEPLLQPEEHLAWSIVVWNGAERQEWGFRHMTDFQPFLISADAPNIFRDDTKLPPLNPPMKKRGTDRQPPIPPDLTAPPDEMLPDIEPKELFG